MVLQFVAAFAVTTIFILLLRPVAARYGLMDYPGGRKTHQGAVPRIGGLAMFGGAFLAPFIFSFSLSYFLMFIAVPAFVVFVGFWDDSRGLSAGQKLTMQVLAAASMILLHGIAVYDLGAILNAYTFSLGWLAVPFTVFAVVGMMNAMNMIDGMDGLAGGVALVAFVLFAVVAAGAGQMAYTQILCFLTAAVAAFLCFNVRLFQSRPARVFMGDAGSLFLGFTLAWFSIGLSQGETRAMSPVTALWILAMPLFDTVSLMLRRLLQGHSPFHADRRHLHHLLQDLGYSVNQALRIILGLALALGTIGVGGYYGGVSEAVLFYAFMALFAIYFGVTHYLWGTLEDAEGVAGHPKADRINLISPATLLRGAASEAAVDMSYTSPLMSAFPLEDAARDRV